MATLYPPIRVVFTKFTSNPDASGKEKTTSAATWAARLAVLSLAPIGNVGAALAADGRANLVDRVRAANDRFKNVSVAASEDYTPIPCASGADRGAVSIHHVIAKLNGADAININHPRAVMCEPMPDGKLALIAAEYITSQGPPRWRCSCSISTAPPITTALARSTNCMCGLEGEPARRVCGHDPKVTCEHAHAPAQ